jgi:hypothetical protein
MTDTKPLRILSLGAGVQSSTLALMAATGFIEPIDHSVFADTQAEPASVYRWLDWLEAEIARSAHPFPVHRVTHGSLEVSSKTMHVTADGRAFSRTDIPFFTMSPEGAMGKIPHRSCTRDYKIFPVERMSRELAGVKRGQKHCSVHQLIGISRDEAHRAKPARARKAGAPVYWVENQWPLLELGYYRGHCLEWMRERGYPEPPRSACVFCPFHSDDEWIRLRDHEPDEFARAVRFEKDLQSAKVASDNFSSIPYLHRACLPLDKVDLMASKAAGQVDLWGNECEGFCGN